MSDSLPLPFSENSENNSSVMLVAIGVIVAAVVLWFVFFRNKPAPSKITGPSPPPPTKPVQRQQQQQPPMPDSIVPFSVAASDRATRPLAPNGIDAYSGKQPLWAEYQAGPQYEFQYNQPENRVKTSVIEVTSVEAFEQVLKNKPVVVVGFTMKGCPHCVSAKPEYIAAATKTAVPMLLLDEANAHSIVEKLGIKGFPTFIKFKDGLPFAKFENMPRTSDNFVAFANN